MSTTIKEYRVTWHDMESDGACFDEDKFYSVNELIDQLKHSKESVVKNYCDKTKTRVWAYLSNGQMIEIVDVER